MKPEDTKTSAKRMVRNLGLIVVVFIFADILAHLPGVETSRILGVFLVHWIFIIRSVVIVLVLVGVIPPLSRFAQSWLSNTILDNVERSEVRDNISGLVVRAIQLGGAAVIYSQVVPVVNILVEYRVFGAVIPTLTRWTFFGAVIVILLLSWKNIDPLLHSAGESVASAADKMEKRSAPGRKDTTGREKDDEKGTGKNS
ncbi:MAG: hypothetical protein WCE90_04835 [Candidatus Zixiibacteriota bacterium]